MDETEDIVRDMDDAEPMATKPGTLAAMSASIERTERQISTLQGRARSLAPDSEDARKVAAEIAAHNRMLQNMYEERSELELKGESEETEETTDEGGKDGFQY